MAGYLPISASGVVVMHQGAAAQEVWAIRGPSPVYDASMSPFLELLEASLANKRGLIFYLNGQIVAGYVTKIGDHAVEVRNQQHDRVILLLDRLDGVAQ